MERLPILLKLIFLLTTMAMIVKGENHHNNHHNQHQSSNEPEVDALKCPMGCVCQYAHFGDLPISRWINHMQTKQPGKVSSSAETAINNNEAVYEGDESFLTNPFIKQATCILQEDNDPAELVNSLPHDMQALVLLYTGVGRNKTVPTSILQTLNQLTTLEIRGPRDRSFKLIIDEPLSFLQHANFESITLLGSDTFKRPKNPVHPRESFKYIPNSERIATYNEVDGSDEAAAAAAATAALYHGSNENDDNHDDDDDDSIEILPYDVYLMEMKKSQMATFYGWEHLEVLRIHGCKMNELHWEMFDGLNALQHLSLDHNGIKIVPAFALYGALHIKTLSLANNLISDLHYRSLAGLLELEILDLSDNRLTKLSELSFPPFPNLEHIDFRNNPIRYIFPATFGVMNKTKTMQFGSKSTALELWGNMPFEALKDLQRLSIQNVSIGVLEHNIFQGLTSLRMLQLKGDIRSIEFDAFADMTELRELDLSDCKIREISMDSFMGCKKLEIIDLSKNNLSYIPPGLFDDQTILEEVYLQANNLRYLPSTFFNNNPAMKLVRLTDNPWKCSCDMVTWKPKITNQERGPRMERCIKSFHTGKTISCHQVDNYKFDNKLSPRCANQNGRSVYYVLRRILQCHHTNRRRFTTATATSSSATSSTWRAMKFKHLEERRDRHKEKVQQKKQNYKLDLSKVENSGTGEKQRLTWQEEKINKIQRTIAQRNSIDFLLNNNQNYKEGSSKLEAEDDVATVDRIIDKNPQDVSNDI